MEKSDIISKPAEEEVNKCGKIGCDKEAKLRCPTCKNMI